MKGQTMNTTKDKLSKIDKIEGNKKAQDIITKAQNVSTDTKSKKAEKKVKPAKEVKAAQKPSKNKKSKEIKSFTIGDITISASAKKIAKIETFFQKFIKSAEDKNTFAKKAILRHIRKKCKKK